MGEKTPWEQHASAAGLPRFKYKSPSSTHALKGFLITCALDREKSATKEAMEVLTKYFGSPSVSKSLGARETEDVDKNGKKVHFVKGQLSLGTVGETEEDSSYNSDTVGHNAEDECACSNLSKLQSNSNQIDEKHSHKDAVNVKRSRAEFESSKADDNRGIFLLKMSQKGIISIFWESGSPEDPVILLSKVIAEVENGSSSPLRWCHRMVPIQASCVYSRESFSALVTKLVLEYLGESLPAETRPLKYAVSFNRHGFEAREVDGSRNAQNGEGLDRMTCIHLVTAALTSVAPHTVVDLRAPQMVVIVEVIPFAGIQSSPICGIAVLSGAFMKTKPRLSVKSLVPGTCQGKQSAH